nr:MAG TPA: hypothetical protein [Caudoviricetes sp.]
MERFLGGESYLRLFSETRKSPKLDVIPSGSGLYLERDTSLELATYCLGRAPGSSYVRTILALCWFIVSL